MGVVADRINGIVRDLDLQSYLEIGVYEGGTFKQVKCRNKVGVDPSFKFDWEKSLGNGSFLYEMRSDEYFTACRRDARFDIFYIDGLHTFEQTLRDFVNCVACAEQRATWVIDDTVPCDVYSTLRSWQDCRAARREAGSGRLEWHGDVYKVVGFIHDFFPSLDYRTIVGAGNPQTLVWRSADSHRQNDSDENLPFFGSLEELSRWDYFRMKAQSEILRIAEEAEVLDAIRAAYTQKGTLLS